MCRWRLVTYRRSLRRKTKLYDLFSQFWRCIVTPKRPTFPRHPSDYCLRLRVIRLHLTVPASAALAESLRTDWLQVTRSSEHLSVRDYGTACLADKLSHSSDFVNRRKLGSALSPNLLVRRTKAIDIMVIDCRLPRLEQSSTSRQFCVAS